MSTLVCSGISDAVLVVFVGIVGLSALAMQLMLVVNSQSKNYPQNRRMTSILKYS